jgi:hypothetical protein
MRVPKRPRSGAGYSGTPLAAKLGFKPGHRVLLLGAPADYAALVGPAIDSVTRASSIGPGVDIVHLFTASRSRLSTALVECRRKLDPDAAIWVSWPKKASGVATDVTEDVIRAVALPLGFVDVKVCAVDQTWSGLKLVVRTALRGARPRRQAEA